MTEHPQDAVHDRLEGVSLVRHGGAAPLYSQIREAIRAKIQSGELSPGAPIPTEVELQRIFNVSRQTVRQAVEALVTEGYLVRSRGKGTFVLQRRIEEPLPKLVSFTQEMRSRGAEPSTRSAVASWVEPGPAVREALRVESGEQVLKIERVRCADGAVIVVLASYLPRWVGLTGHEDFTGSLYDLFQYRLGLKFAKAFQYIEAEQATTALARALEVSPRSPVLVLRRTLFAEDGRPIESVEGFYRADRYRYSIWLEP